MRWLGEVRRSVSVWYLVSRFCCDLWHVVFVAEWFVSIEFLLNSRYSINILKLFSCQPMIGSSDGIC